MTNLQEIKDMQKELNDKIAKLEDVKKPWPHRGDVYWYVDAVGCTSSAILAGCKWNIASGNCFHTQEGAALYKKQLIVLQKLKVLAGDWDPDWGPENVHNWCVYYTHGRDVWITSNTYVSHSILEIYFQTEQLAQAAIDELGDELDCLLEVAR